MVNIGFKAFLVKFLVTLPVNKCAKPVLPWVLKAIKSALISLAKFKIPFSTDASLYMFILYLGRLKSVIKSVSYTHLTLPTTPYV